MTAKPEPIHARTAYADSAKEVVQIYARFYRADCVHEVLGTLRKHLSLIQEADSRGGEDHCTAVVMSGLREHGCEPFEGTIRQGISELCHYPPEVRGKILDEALNLSAAAAAACHQLHVLLPTVLAAVRLLDARTKAILIAIETLRHAGTLTGDPYCDIPDELEDVPIDVLRSQPAVAAIMEAYDMAKVVIDADVD